MEVIQPQVPIVDIGTVPEQVLFCDTSYLLGIFGRAGLLSSYPDGVYFPDKMVFVCSFVIILQHSSIDVNKNQAGYIPA